MKIYNWKLLIVTILFAIISSVIEIRNIINGEIFAIIRLISWGYIAFRGFRASLTFEGYSEDILLAGINKKVIKDIFGPGSHIVPYIGFLLIILAGLSFKFIPSQSWISILLFIIGFIYQALISILIRKHTEAERKKYF